MFILSAAIYHLYKSIHALIIEKKRAETANIEKVRLMTNISHDLRTPITVILGYADAIIDGIALADHVDPIARFTGDAPDALGEVP